MNKWIRYILAVFEIVGGLLGIWLIFMNPQYRTNLQIINFGTKILFTCVFLLFILGIIGGIALLKNTRLGIVISTWYQAFQVLYFWSPIISYEVLSGLEIGPAFLNGKIVTVFKFGSGFNFFIGNIQQLKNVKGGGINLVALAFFIYLLVCLRYKKPIEKPIQAPTNQPLLCPKCGRGYDNSWKVCLYCRTELVKNPDYSIEERS